MERELYIEQSTERMQKARTPDAKSLKKKLLAQSRISTVMGLLCLLPCHVAKAAEEGARPGILSLAQALKLAEERNRTLENSALDVAIARDQVGTTKSYLLPQVKISGTAGALLSPVRFKFTEGMFGSYENVGPIPKKDIYYELSNDFNYSVTGQLLQPISQLYRLKLTLSTSRINVDINQEKLRSQNHKIKLQVKQVYYALAQAQSSLKAADSRLAAARELQRVAEESVAKQSGLKVDSMDAKAKVEQAGVLRQEVIDDMIINREKLNLLLGNSLADDLIVESLPALESIEESLETARNYARAHRPEITISKLQVRNSELSQRISRSAYVPDVSLTVSQTRVSDNTIVTSVQSMAGVTAQWDIFDGGRRRSEVSASNKKLKQARNLESEAEDQVMIEVGASFKKLQRARTEVNVAELLFSTEQEKLRLVMESLAAESSLRQDVLKQQSTAEAAASQLQQALTKFWLSKAEFENAIGLE